MRKKRSWNKSWADASLLTRLVSVCTLIIGVVTISGFAFGWIEGCFVAPAVNKARWELLKLHQQDSSTIRQFYDDFIDSCKDLRGE